MRSWSQRPYLRCVTRFATLILLAFACLTFAATASAETKDQSFQKARTCLLKKGATSVVRRGDGGGFTYFRGRGSSYWTYKTFLGQVSSVTFYFAGTPAMDSAHRATVKACLARSFT
jgi:hypothetical protein